MISCKKVQAGPKLVIDHDGGADDAMAIFLALIYEQNFNGPKVLALTTIHGNVAEEQAFKNSQIILDIAKRRDVLIYRGSRFAMVHTNRSDGHFGKNGLGDLGEDVIQTLRHSEFTPIKAQAHHAAEALVHMSKKYEGELTVVATGPVTNIALAVKLDPKFISRLKHLYIAAGNIYSDKYPKPELNAFMDVEGYYIVTDNALVDKVTFIPYSPFFDLHNISMDWRINKLGCIKTSIMKAQNKFRRTITSDPIWNPLDPKAMAMVLENTLIRNEMCSDHSIIMCGRKRGCEFDANLHIYPENCTFYRVVLTRDSHHRT
ncbi:inosine-uridine preferring nucleoside hydrolase domain-containing protein [Phthorimaea operculella]|nr:inosine-uridine preferring nucleoside hydrolase domain-containing protein [Phthorimaea operculella]